MILLKENSFFFKAEEFATLQNKGDVLDLAYSLLSRISGIYEVVIGLRRPLMIKGIMEIDDTGNTRTTINKRFDIKMKITGDIIQKDKNGKIINQLLHTDAVKKYMEAAILNSNFSDAFLYLDAGITDWTKLYAVYELALKDRGKKKVESWFDGHQNLNRFTATANNRSLGGIKARHAKDFKNLDLSLKLDLNTAEVWIHRLLSRWATEISDN